MKKIFVIAVLMALAMNGFTQQIHLILMKLSNQAKPCTF